MPRNRSISRYAGRSCGPRVSKKNPDAYTKEELVALAINSLGLSKSAATKLTKEELCDKLNKGEKKVSRKKSRKVTRKVSKKKSVTRKVSKVKKSSKKVSKSKKVKSKVSRKTSPKVSRKPVRKISRKPSVKIPKVKGNCIKRSLLPLKEHQTDVIDLLDKRRGVIAVHSTGSGKTLTAVTASQCYLDKNPKNNVIVITPVSLQTNFKKEMEAYGANVKDPRYHFYTMQGFAKAAERGETPCRKSLMIVDEAHNLRTEIKGKGTKLAGATAQKVVDCAIKADKVLLLTATPVVNRPYDLANLIAMVEGKKPMSKSQFNKLLDDPDKFYETFACKTSFYSPAEEEYKEYYPKFNKTDIFLEMSPDYYRKYMQVENDEENKFISSLFGESDLTVFYNGVRRASNNLDNENSPKIQWIMSKIEESDTDDKFVIFSHFLEAGIKLLMKRLKAEGIPFAHIDGSMNIANRKRIVDSYNANKIKVLLISKAGGEGLDLKETRYIITLEPSWNETVMKQVIGRAIRFKSHYNLPRNKQIVDVYHLHTIKPAEKDGINYYKKELILKPIGDGNLSVDLYLRNFSLTKQKEIEKFLRELKDISIEELDC